MLFKLTDLNGKILRWLKWVIPFGEHHQLQKLNTQTNEKEI